ncbi:MAG TPA: hypothetical protein VE467_15325, partial [Chryseolinea sp.]|nr:hypothetical protein [Chryseolinea sp.]
THHLSELSLAAKGRHEQVGRRIPGDGGYEKPETGSSALLPWDPSLAPPTHMPRSACLRAKAGMTFFIGERERE